MLKYLWAQQISAETPQQEQLEVVQHHSLQLK